MCTHLDKTGSTYYFRRPVPTDLIGYFTTATGKPRKEWKFSLRTRDREEAKRLLRPHVSESDALIDDARAALTAVPLTTPVAPADELRAREEAEVAAQLAAESAARHLARSPERIRVRRRLQRSTAEMEPADAAFVDLMREKEAEIAKLQATVAAKDEAAETGAARASALIKRHTVAALTAFFERYAGSGAANPKTVVRWRSRVAALVSYLGHDDVSRVTRADLNRWIESLVALGLSKKTIEAGYLPPVKVTLGLAVDDELIPTNPASALRVRAPRAVKLRERDLTDDEAQTILNASLSAQPAGLAEKHALARRWVPWLCAYTGARVGEITQLRAKDVRREQGVWIIHITPEAGSVKTHEARSVPLHSHLIEQGLAKLAIEGDETPLFYTKGAGNEVNPASKIRAADLAKWARTLGITAPAPNHGWRHRFKTIARATGLEDYLIERIQGHAPRNAAGGYGFVNVVTLQAAIERLPRYEVGNP